MTRRSTGPRAALSLLTVLTLAGSAAPVAAQQDDDDRRQPRTFTIHTGRPRIGVMVESRANSETDRFGARIAEVTPDGPADKAGLKAGDIITKFNGTALSGLKGEDEESGPGAKLVELARALDAGDTVQVEYRRDGQTRKATLVAEDLGGQRFTFRGPGMERMLERLPMKVPGEPHVFRFDGTPGADVRVFADNMMLRSGLRLADLNPDLGEYFGTKEGVLVLEAPKDSSAQLRAGDVILSIDGRTPKDEAHAHRILRSYSEGETAKLEVMRKQRKITVTWKAGEHPAARSFMRTPEPSRPRVRVERS